MDNDMESTPRVINKNGIDITDITTDQLYAVDYIRDRAISLEDIDSTDLKMIEMVINRPTSHGLIPINKQPADIQAEYKAKAGKALSEAYKKRKTAKEILNNMLARTLDDSSISDILSGDKQIIGKDKDVYSVMIARIIQEANKGNVKAFDSVRDTAGDKPGETVDINANLITDADRALMEKLAKRTGTDKE